MAQPLSSFYFFLTMRLAGAFALFCGFADFLLAAALLALVSLPDD